MRRTMTNRIALPAAVAALALLLPGGCRTPPVTPSPDAPLHHHNWWNYYQRGVALLARNQAAEAQADFERCLGLRAGAKYGFDQDRWRARTYGLHVIDSYFPNRELGICHYTLSRTDEAIRLLEISLKQAPSGRAKHYLNLARAQSLRGQTVAPPQIEWAPALSGMLTRDRHHTLRGTANAAGGVRHLSVNGQVEFIELAEPSLAFARPVELTEGTNTFAVEVRDLLGQPTVARTVRVADWRPPQLTLQRARHIGSEWLVDATCRDDHGLAEIRINDTPVPPAPRAHSPTSQQITLRISDRDRGVRFTAVDLAGNRLDRILDATDLHPQDPALGAVQVAGRLTAAEMLRMVGPLLARDEAGGAAAPDAADADRLRPSLSLRDAHAFTLVFNDEFFVDGTAVDNGGLGTISINGENLLAAADRGAVRACFARRLPLDLGTNRFEIAAVDLAGNRTAQPLTVIRRRPEYLDESLRLTVGVPPLTPTNAGAARVQAQHSLERELLREPVRFRLLEREEGWDYILREQGLSLSDLADPAAALRIGKLLPAELLFMGQIIEEAAGLTVYMRVVDTTSGAVLLASDVYSAKPESGLDDDMAGLAMKLEQGFPLVSGAVIRRQGGLATLNVGSDQGAVAGHRFVVVRPEQPNGPLEQGQICRLDGQPVQLSLERVRADSATARVIPQSGEDTVRVGDLIYAR